MQNKEKHEKGIRRLGLPPKKRLFIVCSSTLLLDSWIPYLDPFFLLHQFSIKAWLLGGSTRLESIRIATDFMTNSYNILPMLTGKNRSQNQSQILICSQFF